MAGLLQRTLNALPFSIRYEMFYQAARSLGVESYAITGSAGTFCGPVSDVTITKSYLNGVVWPQREIEVLTTFFAGQSGTLYDIGANVGMVSIPLARAGVSVIAFEPDPLNCSLLRGNIARNRQNGIQVVEKAVYREKARLRFAKSPYNSGDHHIASDGQITVEAVALDDLPIPGGPFAIKIDTQGAEPGVFEGGEQTIAAADMVLSEFWPYGIKRMGNTPDAVLEAVRAFPHGRLIDKRQSDWMTGSEMADALYTATKSLDPNNDMDFIVSKVRF